MEIVIHRVNTIKQLKTIRPKYGVEIDLRADGSEIVLNHTPYKGGCQFTNYLEIYHHGLMILNIKEAGIENDVLRLVRQRGIQKYFLLDVEFPYIFQASRQGERAIAMRYSEVEYIETVLNYAGKKYDYGRLSKRKMEMTLNYIKTIFNCQRTAQNSNTTAKRFSSTIELTGFYVA